MKKSVVIIVVALVTLLAAGGAGAAWYKLKGPGAAAKEGKEGKAHAEEAEPEDKGPHKYVSLDKVVVMLKRSPGESGPHYLSMDLVFKASDKTEKLTKEHLPMLRSVAVKALSTYTLDKASGMSIDDYATALNTAYKKTYGEDPKEKPFSEAMIGKLIIE